ncbi:hypothetical protein [Liquorilactobacillus satsumensis]|uniref:hypothetical protein n=1 Tax=Liquorilactobacillus satsumensis TaxID=259059 RepID=UPI0039E928E8
MKIISMLLVAILLLGNLRGWEQKLVNPKKQKVKVLNRLTIAYSETANIEEFITKINSASCLGFIFYFLSLIIVAFNVNDKISIVVAIGIIVIEVAEAFVRTGRNEYMKNTGKTKNEILEATVNEGYQIKFITVELIETVAFVYLIVMLFQSL